MICYFTKKVLLSEKFLILFINPAMFKHKLEDDSSCSIVFHNAIKSFIFYSPLMKYIVEFEYQIHRDNLFTIIFHKFSKNYLQETFEERWVVKIGKILMVV